MDNRKIITAGHLSALITILIWGTTFIATKILLEHFTPTEILFFRFTLGYVTLLLVYPHYLKCSDYKQELTFAAAGLCGVTLYFLLENIALTYTLASNVGIIVSIGPFFTAIFAHWFLKEEKLEIHFFTGFAAAMLGIILVQFNGNFILQLNPLGDVLATLAALTWAVYSVLMKKISQFNYNNIQCTRKVFFYGLIFMLPALALFDFSLDLARFTNIPDLLNIFFLGFGASALCFVSWNWSVGILGVVRTSVYIYMVPVITIVASAMVLHEKITGLALLGTLLILVGLYISQGKIKEKRNIMEPGRIIDLAE